MLKCNHCGKEAKYYVKSKGQLLMLCRPCMTGYVSLKIMKGLTAIVVIGLLMISL